MNYIVFVRTPIIKILDPPLVRGLRRWRGAAGGTDGGSGMLVRARRLVRTGRRGRLGRCTMGLPGFLLAWLENKPA